MKPFTQLNNYEKAVRIYEFSGVGAVFDAVAAGELSCDDYRHCVPCEETTPHEGGSCLVCGTFNGGMKP